MYIRVCVCGGRELVVGYGEFVKTTKKEISTL